MTRAPYHRSYRHLSVPPDQIGWNFLVTILADVVLLAFAPVVMRLHGDWLCGVLSWMDVPFVERVGRFGSVTFAVPDVPSFTAAGSDYALILAIAGWTGTAVVFVQWNRITPYRVLGSLASFVIAVSATFFFFAGSRFPYSTANFAEVWMAAEFSLWVIIPILFAIALAPFPFSVARTLLYTITALFYGVWFSVVRLAVLLALFHYAGLVWMAPAYFLVGFLVDFIYIVAIYSLAAANAARIVRDRGEVWAW